MRLKLFLFFLFVAITSACENRQNEGYTALNDSVLYKIHFFGDGNIKPKNGDEVFAQIDVKRIDEKLLYSNGQHSGSLHHFNLTKSNNLWNKIFSVMHEGDSASFKLNGMLLNLGTLTEGKIKSFDEELILTIKLTKVLDENDRLLSQDKVVDNDFELQEFKKLDAYFKENNINSNQLFLDGFYFEKLRKGKGKRVQSGDNIWINYKGYFIDGKEFDNTYKRGQMLDFQLGKPGQVIRGFEIALSKMNQGDKVRLYLPSAFAFGSKGSSNGEIPPFTTVIYDLELVKIN